MDGLDLQQKPLCVASALVRRVIFPLCCVLAYLILAAQYNSLVVALAVLLIVPMCLLSAIIGVWFGDGDNTFVCTVGLVYCSAWLRKTPS